MPKPSEADRALPASVSGALADLGRDLGLARRRRRMPQREMAERIFVSVETLHRMEKGDPSVGIGVWASALWVFGMSDRIGSLMAPASDGVAQALDLARTPARARGPSRDMDF